MLLAFPLILPHPPLHAQLDFADIEIPRGVGAEAMRTAAPEAGGFTRRWVGPLGEQGAGITFGIQRKDAEAAAQLRDVDNRLSWIEVDRVGA